MLSEIYSVHVVAKSTTERGNSNNLYTADNSTPFNRAFFVRSIRTPKENALSVVLSMVGRIGQRLSVGYFPCMVVFHPDTFYRQAWKLAVVPKIIYTELSKMIYKFLCLNRTKHTYNQETLYIQADSEEQARLQLSADYRLLLDRPIAKFRANQTACPTPEQNNSLPKVSRCGYDDCTTKTNGGNRSRHKSGIFLPTIPQNHGITIPEIYSKFVARATLRNKPSNRTNKEDYSPLVLVVEPLSRLLSVGKLSKNKPTEQPKMKNPTQTPSGNTARNVSIALSFATKGGENE
ncbi:host cell division inhibitor Icd-like protein [Glaesserella parasuis]|nr:host cell division inhibitor Icd-like protein [Glaesserella parasuis]MDO9850174.1 host cell division inhibitor Icd-like protein [Glaesserella parasuis]MDO9863756.1 host cell division inhibitor Icd-like protein [Glaesserella parasuis]MDO9881461.1 host cell division inhibitor Icd-like protein [Glaesserella parasuis]MDO9883805.1 host cell division inhibitor Icd-like protein [Glaesserella parasuis]